MPQVIAGTASDLTKTVARLVMELIRDNWPLTGIDPAKSNIGFGLGTWDDYGDVDIHVTASAGTSEPYDLSGGLSKVTDPVLVKIFVRKNQEEIPDNVGTAQRQVEQIIKDNITSLGQGITMLRWDGWDDIYEDDNLRDVWTAPGRASAIYWRAKV